MKIKTIKIFSLCEDFSQDDHQEMYDQLSEEQGCDVYIDYTAYTKETMTNLGYSNDNIANRLVKLGANNEEKVLIHIDY